MLDQKTFLQGINYLKANYLNWSFDLNNDLMLKVWYKKFSNLEPNIFMGLVEKYTDINKYAPNSPAELLAILDEQLYSKELSPNEAWGRLIEIKQKYPLYWYYDDEKEKFYNELEKIAPALKQTAKEFETELRQGRDEDGYFIDQFKKAYIKNVKKLVEQQKCELLGNNVLFLN